MFYWWSVIFIGGVYLLKDHLGPDRLAGAQRSYDSGAGARSNQYFTDTLAKSG